MQRTYYITSPNYVYCELRHGKEILKQDISKKKFNERNVWQYDYSQVSNMF